MNIKDAYKTRIDDPHLWCGYNSDIIVYADAYQMRIFAHLWCFEMAHPENRGSELNPNLIRIMASWVEALPSSSTVLHIYIPTWTNTNSSYYVMSGAHSCWLKYYIVTLILRIIACSHVSYEVHPPSIKYHIGHMIAADFRTIACVI